MLGAFAILPRDGLAQPADSKAQIEQIADSFRAAIANKDETAFMKLFLKEDITWTGITTDASIDRIYAARPDPRLKRPFKHFNSSPRSFFSTILKASGKVDETISNLRIDSDGDVAQVWFDFTYVNGGYKENWGKESWQMVRTSDGWKIAGVVWSQELNPDPPPAGAAPVR